jgi:dihydropteroate synthase
MLSRAVYRDLIREVTTELADRLQEAYDAGIAEDQIVLDPGVGFAKTADHNWTLLAMLDRLYALGRPLLIGTSRKSFLGALLADVDGTPRPVLERDDATQATTALVAAAGVWAVRVHAVRPAVDAVRVAQALLTARRAAVRAT